MTLAIVGAAMRTAAAQMFKKIAFATTGATAAFGTSVFVLLCTVGCGSATPPHQSTAKRIQGRTMGTTYQVSLVAIPEQITVAQLQQQIDARLEAINARMSTYDPKSELSQFNSSRSTDWQAVSGELVELVEFSLQHSKVTSGAFDVTVGPLVNLWGFGPRESKSPPSPEQVAAARQRIGFQHLQIRKNPPALRKAKPDLYVDLSAVAKGYAVDEVAELMAAAGCKHFLVEIGGEIACSGENQLGDGSQRPWRVAIERPVATARAVEVVMPLTDQALATSGDYRNFVEVGGKRYSHAFDPRAGAPIRHQLVSASVVAKTCQVADAWATALLVMGEQEAVQIAKKNKLAVLLMVREQDGFRQVVVGDFPPLTRVGSRRANKTQK